MIHGIQSYEAKFSPSENRESVKNSHYPTWRKLETYRKDFGIQMKSIWESEAITKKVTKKVLE